MEKNVLHDIRLKMEFLLLCAMLVLSVSPAYAQRSRTIHGIVVDENKEPLPAAHVKQVNDDPKGSIAAVITDIQGHFTLTLPYGTKEIEASYLGYTSQRIKLTATNDYYIALQPSTELLDEVVDYFKRACHRGIFKSRCQEIGNTAFERYGFYARRTCGRIQ